MIPKSITLENFLSYTEPQTLDFTRFDLACFTGKNGHGKSTIVDAFCWCVWGVIPHRKPSGKISADHALMSYGKHKIRVEAVFIENAEVYKIRRCFEAYADQKKSRKTIDVFSWQDSKWKLLTEDFSITQSQNLIHAIVAFNYDTFVNTTYLVQGKYDEFTKRNPSQRKDLIIPLVVPEIYDNLREKARRERKELKQHQLEHETRLQTYQHQLEGENLVLERQKDLENDLQETYAKIEKHEHVLESLRMLMASLKSDIKERNSLVQRQKELNHLLQDQTLQKQELESSIRTYQQAFADEETILTRYAHRQKLEEQYQDVLVVQKQMWKMREQQTQAKHDIEQKLQTGYQTLEKIDAQKAACLRQIERKDIIVTNATRYAELQEELLNNHSKRQQYDELQTKKQEEIRICEAEYANIEGQLEQLRNSILQTPDAIEEQIHDLEERVRQNDFAETENNKKIDEITELLQSTQEISNFLAACSSMLEGLRKNKEQTEHLLEKALADEEKTRCPICDTELSAIHTLSLNRRITSLAEKIDALEEQHQQKIVDYEKQKARCTELSIEIKAFSETDAKRILLKDTLEKLREEYQNVAKKVTQRQQLQDRLNQDEKTTKITAIVTRYNHQIQALDFHPNRFEAMTAELSELSGSEYVYQQLQDAENRLPFLETQFEEQQDTVHALQNLVNEELYFTPEQHQRFEVIQKEMERVGLDKDEERAEHIKYEIDELSYVDEQYHTLLAARNNLKQTELHLKGLTSIITQEEQNIKDISDKLDALTATEANLVHTQHSLTEAQSDMEALRNIEKIYLSEKGQIQEKLTKFAECKERSRQTYKLLENVLQKIDYHDALIYICGRDGVPGQILKETLREVEEEANKILERLVDINLQLKFETIDEIGSKDSLNIRVMQPPYDGYYETYSGGQKFRIDFAIRIALSKILAKKAGGKLEFLVIDEGFGTQDEQGLQAIVEAINTILDDFKKVIVVTHLESLQSLFETRIHFSKDQSSSFEYLF